MFTAHGVCRVLPFSLEWTSCPQADQAIKRSRVFRTKGGERGGIERLVPVDYTAQPSHCFFLNVPYMPIYRCVFFVLSMLVTRWPFIKCMYVCMYVT